MGLNAMQDPENTNVGPGAAAWDTAVVRALFRPPMMVAPFLVLAGVLLGTALLVAGDVGVLLVVAAFAVLAALVIYLLRENHRAVMAPGGARAAGGPLEERLEQCHKRLALAERVGLIGSAHVDPRTETVIWSDQFFALLGLDPARVRPSLKAFLAVVHPDDRDLMRDATAQNRLGITVAPMEFRVQRADGAVRWLSWQTELVVSAAGSADEVVATIRDVTERKRAEAQNRELLLRLAHAQRMDAVGRLTGGIAHDFNNLLAVLLGRLQLIAEELPDKPDLREWVQSSIDAVDRGAALTKSLVAFSRRQAPVPVELDLNAVLSDSESMLRQTLGEPYQLRVVKAPDLWHVEADLGQMQSALLNLVLNARDAMLKDGVVTLATANVTLKPGHPIGQGEARPGDYVSLTVSDTGMGMSAEVAHRAFEPFFTTKDMGKGSGLGLSMVYGFVKQNGGYATIDSEPGKGTTLRVYLPRKAESAEAAPAPAPEVEMPPAPLETGTILLVEDNDELRKTTRLLIERLGYAVREAGHGAEALRILREVPRIDLLLTDVVMPFEMSGSELAETATALYPNLKVIFMSGHDAHRRMLDRFRRSGTLRFLQKPFHVDELAAQISEALG